MIINLFSIFDPLSTNWLLSNWISIFLFIFIIPTKKWYNLNRNYTLYLNLYRYIFKEFKPLLTKRHNLIIFILSIFIFVLINNIIGLLNYIFTATSHLVFTLTISLTVWIALFAYSWINNINNTLVHLIPQGTPFILIPFITLIETVRNLIRPLTLSVRLAANIIAGHLLLVLIRSSVTKLIYLRPITLIGLIMLILLEIAVAFIQAYVIRILITLYTRESIN